MNKLLILVVEDDRPVRNLIVTALKTHDYKYLTAENGNSAILEASSHNPDIVLLDLGLPDMEGVDVIKNIRTWSNMPIIVISARSEDADKIEALDAGADDYITKPFRIQELRARVAAHLRREKREHHSTLSFEPDIRFDLSAKVLYVSEQPVPLTKSEYSICEYLAKNRGQVFTKEQIYEAVFGFDGIGDNSTISTHIKNIRAKLEHFKISPISTVWGIGYKWE